MQTISKSQVWKDLQQRFRRVVDRIGTPLDKGILDTVVALNVVGMNTTASCEGHMDHGVAYPWIDVSHVDADGLAQTICQLLYKGKREDKETKQLQYQHRMVLLQAEQELIGLLNAFYQHHPFDYDRHLSIWRFSNGMPRLQSHGAEYQQFRDPTERLAMLQEYQQEMQAFAEYLKENSSNEGVLYNK
jgi:hypothetical protein